MLGVLTVDDIYEPDFVAEAQHHLFTRDYALAAARIELGDNKVE